MTSQSLRLRRLVKYLKLNPGAHKRQVWEATGVAWDEFPNLVVSDAQHHCYLDERKLKDATADQI